MSVYLCEKCMAAYDGEILTVGVIHGKCSHCGVEGGTPQISMVRHGLLWPRPIPVSERLPEVGERVLWFNDGDWEPGEFKRMSRSFEHAGYQYTEGEGYYEECEEWGWTVLARDGIKFWMRFPPAPTEGT